MKLYTTLTETQVRACLAEAQEAGLVAPDIEFDLFAPTGSRSHAHAHAYEVHLATAQQRTRADGKARPIAAYTGGNGRKYAATRDEWGWFLAAFFGADPNAQAWQYKGDQDFHRKTRYAYVIAQDFTGTPSERPAGKAR